MIISHKYKFIFIKTEKTAGTSIEIFLSEHCGQNDILTPIFPHVEPHKARNYKGFFNPLPDILESKFSPIPPIKNFIRKEKFFNHIPAIKIKRRVPKKIWNAYFKFCVERNPWDKTLSHYYMINHRSDKKLNFDEYLKNKKLPINHTKYTDKSGRVIVDKIIKYENLMMGLSEVFKKLGIPFDGSLGINAKSNYRKNREHYAETLNENQKKIIEEKFKEEINLLNYKFEK